MQRDDSNDKELRLVDETLGKNKLESPSTNFTHRVMMNLHSVPVASSLSPKNGLLLLTGTVVAVTILTILVTTGLFDNANETISLQSLPDIEMTKNIQKDFSLKGEWIVKGLIFLNIVLAFILFDRTILRPLFNKRTSF
jgi:hypothetical protein